MDDLHLRSILLKLQNRLSNDDQKRLHFYLNNDISQRIQDDPSLNHMDSLFNQDKINNEDLTFLINTFDQVQCFDASKLLKEHLNENQSMQSLSLIMPLFLLIF
ncbi:hypothetical protein I4U23_010860 [Adineta vaga]|nr:hypothetical protein I4U23_010860 [Adineta vaga]